MADLPSVIETMEHRWMRAWVGRDARTLKALTARNFRMVVGAKPAAILDSKSWLDAAGSRFVCTSYNFGDIYAREVGSVAVFATQLEMRSRIEGQDWSGQFWVTDLWRKAGVRRSWRMVERILSRTDATPDVPLAVRSLQLWR